MKNLLIVAIVGVVGFMSQSNASAQSRSAGIFRPVETVAGHGLASKGNAWSKHYANQTPWHGQYYYLPYGAPTALVVPPNAMMQQNYSWGVSQNTMTPIHHQFGANATPSGGGAYYGTPIWPSHTRQFGLYPVRGPW